ncbi:MAG: transketolase family protein [Lachnospiraceae bacterium]|nr:transketolase family protein [Lachnospiraceae bacterium]
MSGTKDVKKVYGNTLQELMQENKDIVVVDIDLMRIAGSDDIKKIFPDCHVNAGIAEQNAVGIAAGFASMGKCAFVSTFCGFLGTRASDQCLDTVCYNELDVKLLGTYAGVSSGINGGTHISIADLAAFRAMPGMKIADISDGTEMALAIRAAVATDGPVYIRVPKGPLPDLFEEDYTFQWGKGTVLTLAPTSAAGKKAAIITSGITTASGKEAARMLQEEGIAVTHVHMASVKPIDEDLLHQIAGTHDVLITVDNHSVIGGLGAAVCESIAAKTPKPVIRLGVEDVFCEGMTEQELMARHGIDAQGICKAVKEAV